MHNMSRRATARAKNLDDKDYKILKAIYDFRCLTANQICMIIYPKHKKISATKRKINMLISEDLIEEKRGNNFETCYFLRTYGVAVLKGYYNLPTTIYDSDKNIIKKGCFTAGDLRVKDKLINHQLHLNQFGIEVLGLNTAGHIKYTDSKHHEKYPCVMPDGILDICGVTFFIEMDLGSEQKQQLIQKWTNYRDFLRTDDYKFIERKIVVLFVLDGIYANDNRKRIVENQAYTVLNSEIDDNFDIYVATKDEMLNIVKDKLIPIYTNGYIQHNKIKDLLLNKFKYKIAPAVGNVSSKYFSGTEYLYIAKEDLKDNPEDLKPMTFVVDEAIYSPFQAFNKICCFNDDNKSSAKLIVVCNSLEETYSRLRQFDLTTQPNVYYTTLERLRNKSTLYEALVNFDSMGNVYSFNNRLLSNVVYEITIKPQKKQ